MRLPRPRSLAAQMALLLGIALLVAQLLNFALILNERQKLSLAQIEGPAIDRFAETAADLAQADPAARPMVLAEASHRGARFRLEDAPAVPDADRDASIEARLRAALSAQGLDAADPRAGTPPPPDRADRHDRESPDDRLRQHGMQWLTLSGRLADGRWLNARLATPRRDPWLVARLGAATLFLYLIVLGATIWIAWRLARPLHALTRAAEGFGGRAPPAPVTPSGPDDLRHAIEAFNAMNLRLVALLDEKDRMLGAIGHDLRTPLASLRIRVESMEPEEERGSAVAKIAEMTAMLEDILVLARTGRAREAARPVDLAALAEAVVEDFAALGRPAAFLPSGRQVAPAQQGLVKRALGNLIDNAVTYGGEAEVSVVPVSGGVEIRVADRGPGIAPEDRERVLQPFARLESSRSRETGGAGLGLAIARGIAESHGGRLELRSGAEGGLTAALWLPGGAS